MSYDPQGNLYQKNAQRYVFTQDNRLRNVTGVEYYRYDGHGRRTLSYLPARGNTFSLYGTDGVLRYMKDDSQSRQEEYVCLAGSLVAIRETVAATTSIKYQHTDALGSPAAVTDAARGVVERSEREPYGKLLNRAVHNGPGYTGHAEDAATGLTYMQQRYYDSGIGAFLSTDPVTPFENPGAAFNRYWYANSNPFHYSDPDGRQSCRPGGCVATADRNFYRVNPIGQAVAKLFDPVALVMPGKVNPLTEVALTQGQAFDAKVTVLAGFAGVLSEGLSALRSGGSLLTEARAARNSLATELAPLKGKAPATVTGGFNPSTGQVAARACGGGNCAETNVVDSLGGDASQVIFTEAMRPRNGVQVPICQNCEATYGRDVFPAGTKFKSDGAAK